MKQVQLLRYLHLSGDDDDFTFFEYIHYIYICVQFSVFIFAFHYILQLYSSMIHHHLFLVSLKHCFDDDEWMNSSFETFQNRYCFDNRFRILFKHDCSCFVALGRFSSY